MWDNTIRPRYIYLLAFTGRVVYVGQSVDPVQRIRAHRRPSGGWRLPFQPLIVDLIHGDRVRKRRHSAGAGEGVDLRGLVRGRRCGADAVS